MLSFLEHRIPPPIIGVITLLIIWFIARYSVGPAFNNNAVNMLAAILAITGLAIDIISLGAFKKAKTTFNPLSPEKASALVTGGLYKISRNPMYLGMLLILTGWTLYQSQFLGFIPLLGFVLYMNRFQIIPEEEAMIKNFGNSYRDYMTQTRRWI